MFLPNDLSSRLKTLRQRRYLRSASDDSELLAWAGLLVFASICLSAVVIFSAFRFLYWSDIDQRLSAVDRAPAYDENKLKIILDEFEAKREKSAAIIVGLGLSSPAPSLTDTPATSSDSVFNLE